MKVFIKPADIVDVVGAYNSGQLVVIGSLIGVAQKTTAAGELNSLKRSGMFELPKVAAEAWATLGLPLYLNAGLLTTVSAGGTLVGFNGATAVNPSSVGRVIIGY